MGFTKGRSERGGSGEEGEGEGEGEEEGEEKGEEEELGDSLALPLLILLAEKRKRKREIEIERHCWMPPRRPVESSETKLIGGVPKASTVGGSMEISTRTTRTVRKRLDE